MAALHELSDESFCYLTTTGRISGNPHTIEIWFALDGSTLYVLSGGGRRSDWVRNLMSLPEVKVRIGGRKLEGRARIVTDTAETQTARNLLFSKYQPKYGGDLASWRDRALPVAIDLRAPGERSTDHGPPEQAEEDGVSPSCEWRPREPF